MFANYFAAAIEAAHPAQLDHCARDLWRAHAAELVADTDAQRLAEAIEARRADRRTATLTGAHRSAQAKPRHPSIFQPRREQHARRHPERMARRRRLASTGPLPPILAMQWTTAGLSILRIVADEVRNIGACQLTLAEIAARAGSCRTMVRTTLRQAAELGLVLIEERRRPGMKNLPNRVRIISKEWRSRILRGSRPSTFQMLAGLEATGGKNTPPTDIDSILITKNRTQKTRCKGPGGKKRQGQAILLAG